MESLQLIIVSESSPLHSGRKRKSERLEALQGAHTGEAEPGHPRGAAFESTSPQGTAGNHITL